MAGREYAVLINDAFKRQMDGMGQAELGRIREKLEFLASGLWDTGLRVKKLKGPAGSVVFEARLSKADRLLFTLGRDKGRSIVYAWGIESHDDVNRAKRSMLPENAPFLGFEPLSVEERADLVMDDLQPEYYTQGSFDGVEDAEAGPQRWRVLDDSDWKRLLASSERQKIDLRLYLTDEQRAVLEQPPPLFLSGTAGSGKTTIAVYYLFRPLPDGVRRLFVTNHPYLCAYSERLYDGLAAGNKALPPQSRPRFAPYREIAREIVSKGDAKGHPSFAPEKEVDFPAFQRMFEGRREFSSLDPELAWEEIRGIIKGAKPALNLGRYRELVARFASGDISRRETGELEDILGAIEDFDFMPRVEGLIAKKTGFSGYGDFLLFHSEGRQADRGAALLVHKLIAECLERKAADLDKPLLSFREYQALGKKRAPRFVGDRSGIYAAAEWYQSWLRDAGLWDEIDLTRRAIEVLAKGASESFDLVVCDEAQDFTNIHLFLLFRLVADPGKVVMAGDVKQIVNPSGFRWSDLRALFWERGLKAPELLRLSLNFRSVGGIVALGNALLDLKKRLVGIQSDETKEAWKFRGKTPCLLSGIDERSVAEELSGAGAGGAILVRDVETRERVKLIAGSELVFTIVESKGLEFDSVLLWKLTPVTGEVAALWRRIALDDRLAKDNEARIVHEINLYYVAVTRARNGLVAYEDNLDFWGQGEFGDLFIRSSEAGIMADSWQTISTPEQWREQGDYYFEREYWKAAAECYKNSGDEMREALARGLALFAERRFAEAAGPLEAAISLIGSAVGIKASAAGLVQKAAIAHEESGHFRRAVALWEKAGDVKRSRRCLARALEEEKDYAAAATAWLKLGDKEAALRSLERRGDPAALAELCCAMKLWEKAARAYAKVGRHSDEAECWRKTKDQKKAASAYYAAGDWEKAARYFKLSWQYAKVPDCWLKAGRYDQAAASYLDTNEPEKAIETLRRWIEAEPAAAAALRDESVAMRKNKPLHAAIRYAALGDAQVAGQLFKEEGELDLAVAEFRAAGDHINASRCLEAQEEYYAAATELELDSPDAPLAIQLLERHVRKGSYSGEIDRKLAEKLNEEALSLEAKGELERAVNRFVAIGHVKAASRCFFKLDKDELAFRFYSDYGAGEELGAYIRGKKNFRLGHKMVMQEALVYGVKWSDPDYLTGWPYLLEALGSCRSEADLEEPEGREEIAALVPLKDLPAYKILADPKFFGALDFLISIGHMNGLLLLWKNAVRDMRESAEYYKAFMDRIELAAAAASERAPWFKVLLALMRGETTDAVDIAGLKPWNSVLYTLTHGHFKEVLAWYREHGTRAEFDAYGTYLKLEDVIAEDFETMGAQAEAAIWYERARKWESALRCYRAAADEAGCARMLENTGALSEALALLKKLGKNQDVRRVEKAIASGKNGRAKAGPGRPKTREGSETKQLSLF
jgi:tetratricopeptide (TPR) repeat protein